MGSVAVFGVISTTDKITLKLKETCENNALQRWKNTKEIIINHEGIRMAKDGEDSKI